MLRYAAIITFPSRQSALAWTAGASLRRAERTCVVGAARYVTAGRGRLPEPESIFSRGREAATVRAMGSLSLSLGNRITSTVRSAGPKVI